MHRSSGLQIVIWIAAVAVVVSASVSAQGGLGEISAAEPMPYVRIYADADGGSHFEDVELPFALVDFAPPAPPISSSEAMAASGVALISSPPGWTSDWHPAPQRQVMFVLAGELEVRVSDGEVRRFGPGAMLLVEDTAGTGHVSAVVGEDRAYMVNVPLVD